MKIDCSIISLVVGIVIAVAFIFLLRWRKSITKARQDQEQIDRKLKEDALDRALSNGPRRSGTARSQAPVEIHYNSVAKKESGSMFRLTELAETVTKEYLFSKTDIIYIGEEYGQAAVFQEKGTNRLYCELFPHGGSVYIRLCGKSEARLIRRKQTAPLSENAIQLCSVDRIETQTGIFLFELI